MFAAVQWNWQTILIGTAFLAFLLSAKCIVRSQSGEEEEELVLCLKLLMQKTKVCISFAMILHRATSPRIALLGNLPGATLHRNIEQCWGRRSKETIKQNTTIQLTKTLSIKKTT
ncbi:hypothetical protein GW17_00029020 [Ensete ventricosum]|nr:hypothetical protein GW17_00029020 [Ensete ventricosum]RZS27881.1 hypothetical protein BHM03_00061412 [Ensete ventricosum]